LGRFLSPDPIGFAGFDANLYRYIKNSPTNGADPLGLADAAEYGINVEELTTTTISPNFWYDGSSGLFCVGKEHILAGSHVISFAPKSVAVFHDKCIHSIRVKLGNYISINEYLLNYYKQACTS